MASTISELRASGVKPPDLAHLGDRGSDVAALLVEYDAQLRSGSLADITGVFNLATELVSSASATKGSHPILLLDVPIASLAERQFLNALASKHLEIFATVVEGDSRTIAALRGLVHEWDCGTARSDRSLNRLQNFVFSSTPASSLTYALWKGPGSPTNLWSQSVAGGPPRQITNFPDSVIAYDWSPDGKHLAYTRYVSIRDLVLISNFR